MTLKINEFDYYIIEASQEQIREVIENYHKQGMEEEPKLARYMGLTLSDVGEIYLDRDLPDDRKRQVLMHELMHAYISSYITNTDTFNLEAVCDISANSHDIIHKITEDYFKKGD